MCEDNSETGIYGILYLDPREAAIAEPPPPCEVFQVLTTDEVGVEQPQQIATSEVFFGKEPVDAFCIHCGKVVKTVTESVPGNTAHVPAFRHCSFGFYCGCCLFPYVLIERKDVIHKCPHCQDVLGRYKRC